MRYERVTITYQDSRWTAEFNVAHDFESENEGWSYSTLPLNVTSLDPTWKSLMVCALSPFTDEEIKFYGFNNKNLWKKSYNDNNKLVRAEFVYCGPDMEDDDE